MSEGNTGTATSGSSSDYKTKEELQSQWASGRDSWKDVPMTFSSMKSSSSSSSHKMSDTINIQTKIKEELGIEEQIQYEKEMEEKLNKHALNSNYNNDSTNTMIWPEVVMQSILYGFGAYNPRGQTFPDDVNKKQHLLLQNDIEQGIQQNPNLKDGALWWQGASTWSDGSTERGFIVAFPKFPKEGLNSSSSNSRNSSNSSNSNRVIDLEKAHDWIVELAKKYDQGAIYRFEYRNGKLYRETVAVLDEGTDASVEVLRDYDVDIDVSIFSW